MGLGHDTRIDRGSGAVRWSGGHRGIVLESGKLDVVYSHVLSTVADRTSQSSLSSEEVIACKDEEG